MFFMMDLALISGWLVSFFFCNNDFQHAW